MAKTTASTLTLFVRHHDTILSVEIDPAASIQDLYDDIAIQIGRLDFRVSFAGIPIDKEQDDLLSDIGLANEAVVDVSAMPLWQAMIWTFSEMIAGEWPTQIWEDAERCRLERDPEIYRKSCSDEAICCDPKWTQWLQCIDGKLDSITIHRGQNAGLLEGPLYFEYLPRSVTRMTLTNHLITAIELETLSNVKSLKYLDLRDNDIHDVTFENMTQCPLEWLNLNTNPIRTIDFQGISQSKLRYLDLRGLEIGELGRVSNLEELRMSHIPRENAYEYLLKYHSFVPGVREFVEAKTPMDLAQDIEQEMPLNMTLSWIIGGISVLIMLIAVVTNMVFLYWTRKIKNIS